MGYNKPVICICGGGNLGTVIAGVSAANGYCVNILTSHPSQWSENIEVKDNLGKRFVGKIKVISANAADVIPQSDIILLCLPGSVINDELIKIKPYLSPSAVIGSVFCCTGFFISAISVLGIEARLFGFQRVPFIARLENYGHSATLLDYRKVLHCAFWGIDSSEQCILVDELSKILVTPINVLSHALQVTLTNSNPILHPSRLYSLFRNFDPERPFVSVPNFYEDWNDDSSQTLIDCDEEFQTMLNRLGLASDKIPPLLDYYESHDAQSLTRKITSIKSLKGLKAPMIPVPKGMAPDWGNRYFAEDIPYGMLLIKLVCQEVGVPTPHIDCVIQWYQQQVGKKYLDRDRVADSEDVARIACLNIEIIRKMILSAKNVLQCRS